MIEALGTPVVLLAHESFEESHIAGGLDNGFTGTRRAPLMAPFTAARSPFCATQMFLTWKKLSANPRKNTLPL